MKLKKWVSLLVAVAMLLAMAPAVFAADEGYTATLTFIDGWWAVQETDAVEISGPGEYTFCVDVPDGATANGVGEFYITIPQSYDALKDYDFTVNSIIADDTEILIDSSKIICDKNFWAEGEGGNWYQGIQIKIYFSWDSAYSENPAINAGYVFSEDLTVTLAITDPNAGETTPEETTAPAETEAPEETTAPAETEAPEETTAPAETEAPEETTAPAETEAPEETTAPAETEAPEETTAPTETEVPEETAPAAGYTAYLSYADGDWWPSIWGDVTAAVPGAGTYSLSWDVPSAIEGAVVLVIDIGEVGGDAAAVLGELGLTELTITCDGAEIDVDLSKVITGDLENNGRYRIEIYNEYGSTKNASPVDISKLVASENVTITFTLGETSAEENTPDETTPEETTPEETTPVETTPEETTPVETTPEETTPEESTPAETTPEETAPEASEPAGEYTANLVYNASGWWPQVSIDTAVTGPGTYTMSWDVTDSAATGAITFYIDILGGWAALGQYDLTDLTITCDGKQIDVDLSKVLTGDLEEKGNYRIEIYNEWGNTKNDSPIDLEDLVINENLTVSFTLGTADTDEPVEDTPVEQPETNETTPEETTPEVEDETTETPAADSNAKTYTAKMCFYDADWWPGKEVETTVTANGVYTFSWDLEDWETVEGAIVFYIDILGAGSEVEMTDMTITVDGVKLDVDMSKVLTGDLEGNGNYRIEIHNEYGSTKANSPIDYEGLVINDNLTVTITLGTGNPQTGDETHLVALVMLMAVACLAVVIPMKKRFA